jgi:NAD(P)-dependent dehydrogenase (short-subunit alcohol dehydrogenase family)
LIATSWSDAILKDPLAAERRLGLTPLRRIGQPWEFAAAALLLASPASAFITGHTSRLDIATVSARLPDLKPPAERQGSWILA